MLLLVGAHFRHLYQRSQQFPALCGEVYALINIPFSELASKVKQSKLRLLKSIDAAHAFTLPLRTINQHIMVLTCAFAWVAG